MRRIVRRVLLLAVLSFALALVFCPQTATGSGFGAYRARHEMNDLPVPTVLLMCVLSFPLHPHGGKASVQASSHQLRELEKKLRVYLSSRVLVFRKGEIGRHQIKFNSRGYVSAESGSEFASPPNAILFIDLTLTSERAVISGEAVRVRPRTSQPNPLRYSREFKLVTCTIILDVPPGELTLARMIGILCRVFLTREELARTAFHPRGYEPSNFLPGTLP